jgi:hypothetical protein
MSATWPRGIAAACSAACQIEFRLIHIYRDDEMALGMGVEIDHNAQCNKMISERLIFSQYSQTSAFSCVADCSHGEW